MRISSFVTWTKRDGELLLMNTNSQKCLILDEIGKMIWKKIQGGLTKEEIVKDFISEFGTEEAEVIEDDVANFLRVLYENDIIEE